MSRFLGRVYRWTMHPLVHTLSNNFERQLFHIEVVIPVTPS